MPSDRSRTADDARRQYKAPVFQQGRVILDRDLNALQETVSGRLEADTVDVIGPCGTPDDGFAISVPTTAQPGMDFLISPGTMYVGGQRAVFPPADPGQKPFTSYSYFNQPDWINPDQPQSSAAEIPAQTTEVIALRVYEQEVSAVEDPDLLDAALGGPDTTQRIRLMRRVERMPGTLCSDAAQRWLDRGFSLDPLTLRLIPKVTLQVSFTQTQSQPNPCDPIAQGGYLGAENQLIRVQIARDQNGNFKLLWGYDNASFIYRVSVQDSKTLVLNQTPVDAFHHPQAGQTVEVLRTAAILPDQSATGAIVRCVAEASGAIFKLAQSYAPDTGTVGLDQELTADIVNDKNPIFLRVWQAALDLPAAGGTLELTDNTNQFTTGILVTIAVPAVTGSPVPPLPVGAYWMIATRPSTPQGVYPERFLNGPQPPDGPRQWMCPLAVIDWNSGAGQVAIPDCRQHFDNLVELTARKSGAGGCCTITITQDQFDQDSNTLQDAFDQLAKGVKPAKICMGPGTYKMPRPLLLNSRHSGIAWEGCPGQVTIEAVVPEKQFVFGCVWLNGVENVSIRDIRFSLPMVPFFKAGGLLAGLTQKVVMPQFDMEAAELMFASIGIRAHNSRHVSVTDCEFDFTPTEGSTADGKAPRFGAGIMVTGTSDELSVSGCRFHDDTKVPPDPGLMWGQFGLVAAAVETLTLTNDGNPGGTILPSIVRDAVVSNCFFTGLTAAMLAVAQLGVVQVRNNVTRGCYSGFIICSPNAAAYFGAVPKVINNDFSVLTPILATAFDPVLSIGSLLARGYPLGPELDSKTGAINIPINSPTDPSNLSQTLPMASKLIDHATIGQFDPQLAHDTSFDKWPFARKLVPFRALFESVELSPLAKLPPAPVLSLHFSGNDVNCGLANGRAGPAIVVLGDFVGKTDSPPSEITHTVITGNRLSTAPSPLALQLPAALVALIDRVVISGNTIANETPPSQTDPSPLPISLAAIPSAFYQSAMIAVTGNVLQGARILPAHNPQWDLLNATT